MNTMAAFELAARQGADGIELDVHLSRDSRLVVIHDDAVDGATDGSGLVRDMSLDELRTLDAGGWFDERFAGERLPTLDAVFESFGRRLFLNVEIKTPFERMRDLPTLLATLISRHGLGDRVIISSFDARALQRAKAKMPMTLAGFLYQPETPVEQWRQLKAFRHEALHPRHDMVDAALMRRARTDGRFVNVWTVNDIARALQLRDLGVNSVITDRPAALLAALAR